MEELKKREREIGVITAEIKILTEQAQTIVLQYAMEIGRRLLEAKSRLGYGEWGEWLKNEVNFSRSTANNFIRIFEGYSPKQMTFETESNVQTFGHLSYTKALALLAVPEEEREDFAEEVGADSISVRELENKIKEREAETEKARAEAAEAEREAEKQKAITGNIREELGKLEKKHAEEIEARDAIVSEAVERMRDELNEALKAAQKKAKEAEAEAARARAEAEAIRKNPVIPKELADKLRKEENEKALAAAKKALDEAEEKVRNAEAVAEEEKAKAEAIRKESGEKMAAAEKAAAMAEPDIVLFRDIFARIQKECHQARSILGRIEQKDSEQAGKFRTALKKVLEEAV